MGFSMHLNVYLWAWHKCAVC